MKTRNDDKNTFSNYRVFWHCCIDSFSLSLWEKKKQVWHMRTIKQEASVRTAEIYEIFISSVHSLTVIVSSGLWHRATGIKHRSRSFLKNSNSAADRLLCRVAAEALKGEKAGKGRPFRDRFTHSAGFSLTGSLWSAKLWFTFWTQTLCLCFWLSWVCN